MSKVSPATSMTQLMEMLDQLAAGRWDTSVRDKVSVIREDMRRNGLLFIPNRQEIRFDSEKEMEDVLSDSVQPSVQAQALTETLGDVSRGLMYALQQYPDLSDEDISDLMGAFELTSMVVRRSQPKHVS